MFLMESNEQVYVEAQMLIRRPAPDVYNAFIDPAVTTRFWFTGSSGKLEAGKTVTWHWEMYSVSAEVRTTETIPGKKIVIEWGSPATTVEFSFQALSGDTTYVVIRNYGFQQTGRELIEVVRDSTGGFTTVLDGLKAYLEHGLELNLVGDKFLSRK